MRRFSISMLGAALLVILAGGCKANPPGKLETSLVTTAKRNIFVGNKAQKNPLKDDAATTADGKEGSGASGADARKSSCAIEKTIVELEALVRFCVGTLRNGNIGNEEMIGLKARRNFLQARKASEE